MIALPLLTIGQTASSETVKQDNLITIDTTQIRQNETTLVARTSDKVEVTHLSYKKSNDLISIKAYRKSLQIKVKEIKIC